MTQTPIYKVTFRSGRDVINYVVYQRPGEPGKDEVLQHKTQGTSETAHVTIHPNGAVNLRVNRPELKHYLETAIKTSLKEYSPSAPRQVQEFLIKVREALPGFEN